MLLNHVHLNLYFPDQIAMCRPPPPAGTGTIFATSRLGCGRSSVFTLILSSLSASCCVRHVKELFNFPQNCRQLVLAQGVRVKSEINAAFLPLKLKATLRRLRA